MSCIPSNTRCIEEVSRSSNAGTVLDVSVTAATLPSFGADGGVLQVSLSMPGAYVGPVADEEGFERMIRRDTSRVMAGTVRLRDSIISHVSGFFSS